MKVPIRKVMAKFECKFEPCQSCTYQSFVQLVSHFILKLSDEMTGFEDNLANDPFEICEVFFEIKFRTSYSLYNEFADSWI